MNPSERTSGWVVLALVSTQVLFGINFITSKVIVSLIPPLNWAAIRVSISAVGLTLGAIVAAKGSERNTPPITFQFLAKIAFLAFFGIVLSQGSFLYGLRRTTPTNSAVLTTLIPLFTLFFATLLGQERINKRSALGFFSGLVGVLLIVGVENARFSDTTLVGNAFILLNCLSYSLFLILSKKFLAFKDSLWTTAWLFTLGAVEFGILTSREWADFSWPPMTQTLLFCMIFSTFGSTLLAYYLNLWALARVRPSQVALYIYLQPVIASLISWFWLGTGISLRVTLASLLIFSGMVLASRSVSVPKREKRADHVVQERKAG